MVLINNVCLLTPLRHGDYGVDNDLCLFTYPYDMQIMVLMNDVCLFTYPYDMQIMVLINDICFSVRYGECGVEKRSLFFLCLFVLFMFTIITEIFNQLHCNTNGVYITTDTKLSFLIL